MSDKLGEALRSGDRASALASLRVTITAALLSASADKVAALSKELREVIRELDSLGGKKESKVDDLAARRTARRAKTSAQ